MAAVSVKRSIVPDGLNIREETFLNRFYFVYLLFYFFICLSVIYTVRRCYIKTRPDAKFSIVPEEGWFGQPKYSTRSKKHSTLCRFLPLYSSFYL